MRIGFYFGSFNPIHLGHTIIGQYAIEELNLDKLILVISPQSPFKQNEELLENEKRLKLVELATKNYPKIFPSDIEFGMPLPNYSYLTLRKLVNDLGTKNKFFFVMGSDNWKYFDSWENSEEIKSKCEIVIYPRLEYPLSDFTEENGVTFLHKAPIIEISATEIREGIEQEKNRNSYVNDKVWEMITQNKWFKKEIQ